MADIVCQLPAIIHLSKSEHVDFLISDFHQLIEYLVDSYDISIINKKENPIDSDFFNDKNMVKKSMINIWFDYFFGDYTKFDLSARSLPQYVSKKPKLNNIVALHPTYREKAQKLDYIVWKHIIDYIQNKGYYVLFVGRAFGNNYDVDTKLWKYTNKFTLLESLDIISRSKLLITPIDGFAILGGCTNTNMLCFSTRLEPFPFLPLRINGVTKCLDTLIDCKWCTTKKVLENTELFDKTCDKNYECTKRFNFDEIDSSIDFLLNI